MNEIELQYREFERIASEEFPDLDLDSLTPEQEEICHNRAMEEIYGKEIGE